MSQSRSGASSEGCGSSASSLRMNSIKPWFIRSTSTLSTSSGPMKVLLQLLAVLAHEGNFPCWALVRSSAFADKDSMHLKAVMCLLAFVHTQVPFCESRSKPTKAQTGSDQAPWSGSGQHASGCCLPLAQSLAFVKSGRMVGLDIVGRIGA